MRKLPRRILIGLGIVLVLFAGTALLAYELLSSALEARWLAKTAQKMTWRVDAGASERIAWPGAGPYDERLGYSKLPAYLDRLQQAGWQIDKQARISVQMKRASELGLFLPYLEKDQAGLTVVDPDGAELYRSRHPERVYSGFEKIPDILVRALLYIENRELLTKRYPRRNPAVEWDRLAQALMEKGISIVDPGRNVPGGSTLPTQIEKYRHSPDGVTGNMLEKLRQMGTASVRAYLKGPDTLAMRRELVKAYLNTVPLAAAPRYGEVHGIGDGLYAWYGLDFERINRTLSRPPRFNDAAYARALKHALSLIVAERRPSYYLASNRHALDALTNDHLELLAQGGLITPDLMRLAKAQRLVADHVPADPTPPLFNDLKATNAQRNRVAELLGESRLYDLDRLDLQVETTINKPAQKLVSAYLQSLAKPAGAQQAGLIGFRLLKPDNALDKVIYSLTLYEKTARGNLLRIQADNLNQPFDINSQARLDLGSTAKLRTLVSYLEIIARLADSYRTLDDTALRERARPQRNPLSEWVAVRLLNNRTIPLADLLDAAMNRYYSARPEPFFTGGGVHHFANFDAADNGRAMTVWEATQDSVNLAYIRIMRDVVRYYAANKPGATAKILEDIGDPARLAYLDRFVEKEGQVFTRRFYARHKAHTPEQMASDLYHRIRANPRRFTAAYLYLDPDASYHDYVAALHAQIPSARTLSSKTLEYLYTTHAADAYSLADRGYITQIHPLELWVVKRLREQPGLSLTALNTSGVAVRREVYDWLYKTSRKNAQDIRIQSLLEVEAFDGLLADWKRVGYPFNTITPSYATAIGSSGDRPAALAELMGILVNDGVRRPMESLTQLHFGAGTPFDTTLSPKANAGERLLPVEVAQTVQRALARVVAQGTATRLANALTDGAGQAVVIGGKTGTGDHRFERYGRGGQLLESRVVNRTGTLVFYFGKRYFGTLTALVPGEAAGRFAFTSALTAQALKALLPALKPLLYPAIAGTPDVAAPTPAAALPAPSPRPPRPERETPLSLTPSKNPLKMPAEKADGSTSQADPPQPDPIINPPADRPAERPPAPPAEPTDAVAPSNAAPPAGANPAEPAGTSPEPGLWDQPE